MDQKLLCEKLAKEIKDDNTANIDYLVNEFRSHLNLFMTLVSSISINARYKHILFEFINFIKSSFKIKTSEVFLNTNKLTTDVWGPIIWNFLHYSSILLQHIRYENRSISSTNHFATIIYNLDMLLPCSRCSAHYIELKISDSNFLKTITKNIILGLPISQLYILHNKITQKVFLEFGTKQFIHFTIFEYALRYKCFPVHHNLPLSSITYIYVPIEYHSTILVHLIILFSYFLHIQYETINLRLRKLFGLSYIAYTNLEYTENCLVFLNMNDNAVEELMLDLISEKKNPNDESKNDPVYQNSLLYLQKFLTSEL